MPTHFDITSIARRLDAGTYIPRQRTIEIPAVNSRPMREFVGEILASGFLGGLIGFLLGGGLS
jgi:predicted lipid-binding transport protein (Tim44 family)